MSFLERLAFWRPRPVAPVEDVIEQTRHKLRDMGVDESHLRFCIMDRPSRALRRIVSADGSRVGKDWCGAYFQVEAPAYATEDDIEDEYPLPVIYIFRKNIKPPTREETERVVLHEIGHAFNLNEDDIDDLGLG